MKYMGSKRRIAKYILPIMLKDRKPNQLWIEPFVGGANIIDKVPGYRIGLDNNRYLIALLREMQKPNFEAPLVNEENYNKIKNNPSLYPDWKVGFASTQLSWGSKWFDSYRRDSKGKRNYAEEAKRCVDKQSKELKKDVIFLWGEYCSFDIPANSFIYCDPPYEGTIKYSNSKDFDHKKFWEWCREKSKEGHKVFVSEYNAPKDFKCVWQMEINNGLNKTKKRVERLFTL